jgi:hypothetical protein
VTAQPAEPIESLALRVTWANLDRVSLLAVNHVLLQVDTMADGRPDNVLLTFGHVAPPPVTGTPEEQRKALEGVETVEVQPQARVSMSLDRFHEFVSMVSQAASKLPHVGE